MNISIKKKLILLLLIPVLAFLLFASMILFRLHRDFNQAKLMKNGVSVVALLDQLNEKLIFEMNMSLSKRRDRTIHSDLNHMRQNTDQIINQLVNEKTHTVNLEQQKNSLEEVRGQIDNNSISAEEIAEFYKGINEVIATEINEISLQAPHGELSRLIYAYQMIVHYENYYNEASTILFIAIEEKKINEKLYFNLVRVVGNMENIERVTNHRSSYVRELFERDFKPNFQYQLNALIEQITNKGPSSEVKFSQKEVEGILKNVDHALDRIKNNILDYAIAQAYQIEKKELNKFTLIIVIIIFVLFISFILMQKIVKVITEPLKETLEQAAHISEGELKNFYQLSDRKDEFGLMAKALNKMTGNLFSMTSNIKEEINHMTQTTDDIANAISEVSHTTTETATAITETSATIEELKQTAKISAAKSDDVLKSSEHAKQVLQTSQKSIEATLSDMKSIEERMNIISDSIIKLSEHSKAIGKIIDTVNDLAEQSNLLAVNAAIEAAKAGEQGKGFAVVAQEVKSLSDQSKQATYQVHTILNDIQNATSALVMATEQGAKAVSKGVEQSNETSKTILTLSEKITNVTYAAQQIADSSQQQLMGVGQVIEAITSIEKASNLSVEHVHQIAASIKNQNDVAKAIRERVDKYKLN